jgi:ABC-type multidrug transport system fused ATPase/permease subunit
MVPLARLEAARLLMLVIEGLVQLLALIAVARARPPLYGALLALLLWVTLLGEPARALASWVASARRRVTRSGEPRGRP